MHMASSSPGILRSIIYSYTVTVPGVISRLITLRDIGVSVLLEYRYIKINYIIKTFNNGTYDIIVTGNISHPPGTAVPVCAGTGRTFN